MMKLIYTSMFLFGFYSCISQPNKPGMSMDIDDLSQCFTPITVFSKDSTTLFYMDNDENAEDSCTLHQYDIVNRRDGKVKLMINGNVQKLFLNPDNSKVYIYSSGGSGKCAFLTEFDVNEKFVKDVYVECGVADINLVDSGFEVKREEFAIHTVMDASYFWTDYILFDGTLMERRDSVIERRE